MKKNIKISAAIIIIAGLIRLAIVSNTYIEHNGFKESFMLFWIVVPIILGLIHMVIKGIKKDIEKDYIRAVKIRENTTPQKLEELDRIVGNYYDKYNRYDEDDKYYIPPLLIEMKEFQQKRKMHQKTA